MMSIKSFVIAVFLLAACLSSTAQAQDATDQNYARGMQILEQNPDNIQDAIPLLKISTERGNLDAAYNLGVALYTGLKTKESRIEAIKWFKKASEGGDAKATFNLATAYEETTPTAVTHATMIELYTKAAEGGIVQAMHRLGTLTANEGEKNIVEGIAWLLLADAYEDEDVKTDLDNLQAQTKPDQLKAAHAKAAALRNRLEENPDFLNNMSL
jgi:TPR repeat protein